MADHGNFYWNELVTTDPGRCNAFYGTVLGWTSRDMDMGEGGTYTMFQANGTDVGGMFKMQGPQFEGVPPHWMGYIAVDDVDAAVAKVEGAGGAVKAPPFDVPGVGRIAVITDPTGAAISLMTPAPGR